MNIGFVEPAFLTALALVAVPIIVHLFNFRKFKVVYFTNVAFLKELKEETNSRSKLKHLLVLASRILALVFLVLFKGLSLNPSVVASAQIGKPALDFDVEILDGSNGLNEELIEKLLTKYNMKINLADESSETE
jgi:hypothetical protein